MESPSQSYMQNKKIGKYFIHMSFAGLSLYSVEAAAIGKDKQKSKKKATKAARAGLVFTHRGFSGPAVLDLSHHAVMAAERRTEKPGSTAFAASP